jgi:uncharacterized protein YuzE
MKKMRIVYDSKTDLRLDDHVHEVINKRVSEDIGEGDKIVGIEIMDASKRLNLE